LLLAKVIRAQWICNLQRHGEIEIAIEVNAHGVICGTLEEKWRSLSVHIVSKRRTRRDVDY